MIKMPYEQIIEKLVSGSGLSKEEIERKIKEKMDKLSGLISKEGAAHIVANELSVRLFETGRIKVKDVLPGMRSVETAGKVISIYEVRNFVTNGREGKVGSFMMGDESGSMRVVLWGDQADSINKLVVGSIVKIKDGYVRENMNGRKELHLNANSSFILNPQGIEVQEVKKEQRKAEEKTIPSAHDLKKQKETEKKAENKGQKEIEDLAKELVRKGTLRK